jgi:quercetin dioxygenase-like cupin family protein
MFLVKTNSLIDSARRKTTVLSFVAVVCAVAFAAQAADDRVKIDNEQARVLVVTSAPGAKSDLHEHTMNRVMIYLDAGKMTLTDNAGKVETLNFKAGEVLWSAATTRPHVSVNVGDKPVRIVEVELKSKPGGPTTAKPGALDWVKVDRKRYKVENENDQVRVVRAHYGAHEKGVMHEHPWNYVVAFLTDCKLKVTNSEGEARTATKGVGDVTAGGPSKHVEENLNDKPLEVVVVEFKQ